MAREIPNVEELLTSIRRDRARTKAMLLDAENTIAVAKAKLRTLDEQERTLTTLALTYPGDSPEPTAPVQTEDWTTMSRLDAVERVIREAGRVMHVREITDALKVHGRADDSQAMVSMSLQALRRNRGTSRMDAKGYWSYVEPPSKPEAAPIISMEGRMT